MRPHQATALLLTAASCLVGHLGWAQQAPTAPLVPVAPVVAPPVSDLGVEIQTKQSGFPATTPQQNRPVIPDPVVIINGRYLAGMSALNAINPQQIAAIDIYKQGQEGSPVQWRSLTTNGILSLTLKAKPKLKLKARSLAAIKRGLRLPGPVRFELNGAPIQDESLQILTNAIAELIVTQAAPGTADKTVVNIRLVPYQPAPRHYPPGTIMIRGLAQQ